MTIARITLTHLTAVFALAALVTACESDPTTTADGDTTFLEARLQSVPTALAGPLEVEHRGSANWGTGGRSSQHLMSVSSSDREAQRTLSLRRLTSVPEGLYQPGSYSLVPRNFNAGDNDGYTALYLDHETGNHYIAESGTWTITTVDPETEVVTGHFDFTVAYWCNPHNDRDRCFESPKESGFSPDAERINVRGEFRAGPTLPVPPL